MSFFEVMPKLMCSDETFSIPKYSCSKDIACFQMNATYEVDYGDKDTIRNWVTKYDMVCDSDKGIGVLGSLMFAGLFVGSILLTRLSDIFGRKVVLVSLVFSSSLIIVGLIFAPNLMSLYILIFAFGCTVAARYAIVYMYC